MSAAFGLWVDKLWQAGADLLFPPQCVGCHTPGAWLCNGCAQRVEPLPAAICARCGRALAVPSPTCSQCQSADFPFLWVRAAALYTEPLRAAIHALKYEGRVELAEPLSRYLVATVQPLRERGQMGVLDGCLPVPLHPRRLAERGYNQSALLAAAFARRTRYPFHEDWVWRSRDTQSQVTLSAAERQRNVADAFSASPAVAGKRLLLIDDVTTTGATLMACAKAVQAAGATEVYGLVLATPHLAP